MQRKQNLASVLGIQKRIVGNHAFSEINNKVSIWKKKKKKKKTPYLALYFTAFLDYYCLIISKKCMVTRNFLSGFQQPLVRSAFPA